MKDINPITIGQIPTPPFWGAKTIDLPLESVFEHLNLPALFRIGWGAGKASGDKWAKIQEKYTDRLATMRAALIKENWLRPKAAYGFWPAASSADMLHILPAREGRRSNPLKLHVPRQALPPRRAISDYFYAVENGQKDIIAFQVVSMGEPAIEQVGKLYELQKDLEAYFLHGLNTQLTEAAAQLTLSMIRADLDIPNKRGKRYSWGYEPLPDLSQQVSIMRLLDPDNQLGIFFTSAYQFIPEYTTAALFVHHPNAEYFRISQKENNDNQ